ncbi:MAG: beta-lactamase family protein [bacterium]|nr:beta-lactamase family protein [bacterium]
MRIVHGIMVSVALVLISISNSKGEDSTGRTELAKTVTGGRVLAYIDAFNSGDTADMRQFFEQHISEQGKANRPVAVRVERYQGMVGQIRTINLQRVESVSEEVSVVYATNGRGEWMQLQFEFEAEPPHFLAGLGIELMEEPPSAEPSTPLTRAEAVAAIDKLVDSLAREDSFSGNLLLGFDGNVVLTKSVGMADRSLGVPNKLSTKFNLGSINKIFTKIAIAQLVQGEKISLEAPFGKYLIDYPNRDVASRVTVRQLLDMTSGIGDFFGSAFENSPKDRFRSNSDYIPLFASDPLWFEPGTDRRYSNGSYVLLGAIVEAVSGTSYYQYVRDHIYAPAGMTNSDSYALDEIVSDLARGYTRGENPEDDRLRPNIYTLPARGSAAGGGYATVDDLFRFHQALAAGKLLDAGHTAWILTGEPPSQQAKEVTLPLSQGGLGIAGGSPGVNAAVESDLAAGYTLVVLSNLDPPSAEQLAGKVRRLLQRVRR